MSLLSLPTADDACGGTLRGSAISAHFPRVPQQRRLHLDHPVAQAGGHHRLVFIDFQLEDSYDFLEVTGD